MERQSLPDPMPDNPANRKGAELALQEMEAAAKAEQKRIARELRNGASPQEKIDELGGPEEAARIIGRESLEDLQEEVKDQELDRQVNQDGEQ